MENRKYQFNLTELLFYMEEMYSMDMLSEKGTYIYERYKMTNKISNADCTYIHKQIEKWHFEKF